MVARPMDCILHIGLEKTGTTSIQEFLFQNRILLAQEGVLYPQSVGDRNHSPLVVAFYESDQRDDLTCNLGLNTNFQLARFKRESRERIAAECLGARAGKVILSAEHFQSRLRRESGIRELRQFLEGTGIGPIRVVVYLRDPADLAYSLHSTAVKSGHSGHGPCRPLSEDGTGYDPEYFRNACDHRATLQRWGAVFGMENITPRLFRKDQLAEGDIVRDFLSVAGLPPLDYLFPGPRNEALDYLGLEILRRCNNLLPAFVENRPNPRRGAIHELFERYFNTGVRQEQSPDLREAYETFFRDSNEWVRGNYFPHLNELFPQNSKPARQGEIPADNQLESCAALIAELWLRAQGHEAVIGTGNGSLFDPRGSTRPQLRGLVQKILGKMRVMGRSRAA